MTENNFNHPAPTLEELFARATEALKRFDGSDPVNRTTNARDYTLAASACLAFVRASVNSVPAILKEREELLKHTRGEEGNIWPLEVREAVDALEEKYDIDLCSSAFASKHNRLREKAEAERDALKAACATYTELVASLKARVEELEAGLAPLRDIADQYDDNGLDDEARKHWGADLEFTNPHAPHEIELYTGRGGKRLLTLADCFRARALLTEQPEKADNAIGNGEGWSERAL